MHTHSRGFTLIELLVVIAIIGVLSSVVLASLNTARTRARDASIRSEVAQFAILMELQFSDANSYAALQPGWVYTTAQCNAAFSGSNFATTARNICSKIVTDVGGNGMYMGTSIDNNNFWSIMVYLPGKNTTLCRGSSGGQSDTNAWGNWSGAGCYTTP